MEGSKKKPIMIGIIVVCLVLAVVITLVRSSGTPEGSVRDIKRGEMLWVKCMNPECNAEYQIDKRDYYDALQQYQGPIMEGGVPPVVCKESGKESLFKAVKCEKSGKIFFEGAAGPTDYGDRCPECGYSKIEDVRKRARQRQ